MTPPPPERAHASDPDGGADREAEVDETTDEAGSDRGDATAPTASAAPTAPSAPTATAAPAAPVALGAVGADALARATRRAVARALAEDLGDRGDVTSLATVPPGTSGVADLIAREPGVLCGLDVAREVLAQVDARISLDAMAADGDTVTAGQVVAILEGPLRSILTAERTALNFLTHLSGIATRTRVFVDAAPGVAVRDTRKTTPGLRLLEKHAVQVGGGHSHRIGLYDALLVKDNHIAAAGGIAAAVAGALARADGLHVQVEVASLEQLDQALEAGATDVLLDNFSPEQVRQALQRTAGRADLEVSGGVTLDTIGEYASTGVSRIAVGALTHSAPALDLALDVRTEQPSEGQG